MKNSSLNSSRRTGLIASAAALLGLAGIIQHQLDRPDMRRQKAIEPINTKVFGGIGRNGAALPFEYSLGAISGFRQVVAGLLWVRADSFFHQGNYDAILPLIRVITWLDPNFLDVYATGGWHLTYNFTDQEQRSDRRYLPAGRALLNEMIQNNPDLFDGYREAGWLNFDKIKDYDEAIRYYKTALTKKNVDYTQAGHQLAHSYERTGRVNEAVRQWQAMVEKHQSIKDDPKATDDQKGRAEMGLRSAKKNLEIVLIRQAARPNDSRTPADAQFQLTVTRLSPKVIEVKGNMNLQGAKNFDEKIWGPVDGARVDVRLQDAGYAMPSPREFTFEVDPELTIMQDQISIRGGKKVTRGNLFVAGSAYSAPPLADKQGLYSFDRNAVPQGLGVPLAQALASGVPISAQGQRALVEIALPQDAKLARGSADAMNALYQKVIRDLNLVADLTKQGYHVAVRDYNALGQFRKKIDMSQDPKMYSFAKDRYDLIVSFNPRTAPPMVQDRYGWNGEGITDKRFLDTKTKSGLRMLRVPVTLTRDDLTGAGTKVLYDSSKDNNAAAGTATPMAKNG